MIAAADLSRPAGTGVLTILLDHRHRRYPADQIAALYAERWQIELTYARLKVTLREPGTRPRGQTPELANQEPWALLTVYNALVRLVASTAIDLNVDPDAISFTAVLALTRNLLATDCGPASTADTTTPIRPPS